MKIAADATNSKTLNNEKCDRLGGAGSGLSLALQAEHVHVAGLMQLPQTVRPQLWQT
jgi:hypothetical protein